MKKQELIKYLSDTTKIDATKLAEVLSSDKDEIDLELPEIHVFTSEELQERLTNHAKISSKTFIEMGVKEARNDLKEKYGVDFEGKTIPNLVAAAIEAGEKKANVKPNEKINELNGIIERLQGSLKTVEGEWQGKYQSLEQKHNEMVNAMYIEGLIPSNLDTQLNRKKVAALFGLDRKVKVEDGQRVFTDVNGNILRDGKTQKPLSEKEVMESWLNESGFKVKAEGGRGGGNETGQGKTSLSDIKSNEDFYKYCKDNNVPRSEWGKTLTEIQKTNKDFQLT